MKAEIYIRWAVFLLLVSFSAACVREEIIPYNITQKEKLVVFGFLSPGENIEVFVGKSQPFGKLDYQEKDFLVTQADVVISNGAGKQQHLSPNVDKPAIYACSQSDFPIVAGQLYTLTVKVEGYDMLTTVTTVPQKAATWKTVRFWGPKEHNYYSFSGSWDALLDNSNINYGVNIALPNQKLNDYSNENITELNQEYTVKRDLFLYNVYSFKAVLLTRDKALGDFSRKADLTFNIIENISNAAFIDIVSGFKGVIPEAGNIQGGIGAFGSYLKDVRIVNR